MQLPTLPTALAFGALAEALSTRIGRDTFELRTRRRPETEGPRRMKILR
jgi:hypothetical protein